MRDLKAEEIECRVQSVNQNGFSLLLYKDARCDMNILDEAYGAMNWKREHTFNNRNCIVSIWDKEKAQWVSKEDTGSESNTQAQKGLASDSFKRACFNWGIGRELYTAPFIWVNNATYINQNINKYTVREKFSVYHITIENKKIMELGISDSKGNKVYRWKR